VNLANPKSPGVLGREQEEFEKEEKEDALKKSTLLEILKLINIEEGLFW
jgi:hypothetical protein